MNFSLDLLLLKNYENKIRFCILVEHCQVLYRIIQLLTKHEI